MRNFCASDSVIREENGCLENWSKPIATHASLASMSAPRA
jgi:hypothetical protein